MSNIIELPKIKGDEFFKSLGDAFVEIHFNSLSLRYYFHSESYWLLNIKDDGFVDALNVDREVIGDKLKEIINQAPKESG